MSVTVVKTTQTVTIVDAKGTVVVTPITQSVSLASSGPQGATGATVVSVAVGSTTTGAAGTSASVSNSGSSTAAVLDFTIPQGIQGATGSTGATGAAGSAATIAVGTVTTGTAGSNATVTNAGTSGAAVFNFTIPRGDTGAQGSAGAQGPKGDTGLTGATGTAATIAVGTVTTGTAGSNATVTNSGSAGAAIFDFAIPRGDKGETGATGGTGATGPAGTGVPIGGTAGQVLAKINATDYNTQWTTPATGTVTSVTGTAPIVSSGGATPAISVTAASTSAAGVVQLSDSVTTSDSTLAATATAVKSAYDLAAAAVPQTRTITGSFPVNINGQPGTAIPLSGNITISVPDATPSTSGVTNLLSTFDTTSPYPTSNAAIYNYYSSVLGSYAITSYFQSVFYGSSSVLATHPREVLTTTNANTSQTLILTQFRPMKSFTVTNISVTSGATASASLTYCAFGIYTRSGSTFTRARITASDTTIFNTANTKYTRALTSTYSVTAGVEYFIGVLQVGTTMATTLAATARADTAAAAATGVQVYTVTGQTTLGTGLTGTAHATRSDFAEVS
jgi:hypothetical protein